MAIELSLVGWFRRCSAVDFLQNTDVCELEARKCIRDFLYK